MPETAGDRDPLLARAGNLEYDRVLFFSDAVFAIAITLLAAGLYQPSRSPAATVASQLHDTLPDIVGFGISFAVIGLFWLGHHTIFRFITRLDRPLVMLNLLFLGLIAFLPYPTRLLSGHGGQATAVILYAACAAMAGLTELAIWLYANLSPKGLADPSARAVRRRYLLRIGRIPVVFALSIPVAVRSPTAATYLWILLWASGVVIDRLVPHRHPG